MKEQVEEAIKKIRPMLQADGGDVEFVFETDPSVKEKLLLGQDDIAESLLHEADISEFETQHNAQLINT